MTITLSLTFESASDLLLFYNTLKKESTMYYSFIPILDQINTFIQTEWSKRVDERILKGTK